MFLIKIIENSTDYLTRFKFSFFFVRFTNTNIFSCNLFSIILSRLEDKDEVAQSILTRIAFN